MRKFLTLMSCLALALGAFTLAGCGDDDDNIAEETAPQFQPEGQGGDDRATDQAASGATVSVIDNDYDPKDLTIKRGETVKWTWDGQLPHTVTDRGKSFDSGVKNPGATFEQKFDEAGAFNYYCTLHPGQEGTVTVE